MKLKIEARVKPLKNELVLNKILPTICYVVSVKDTLTALE